MDAELDTDTPKNKIKKVKTITIKLSMPIEFGQDTYEELVLTRPKAKQIEHLSSNPTMKELLTVAQKCARVPRRVIDELDADDAMEVIEAVGDFLDAGEKTGRKLSY